MVSCSYLILTENKYLLLIIMVTEYRYNFHLVYCNLMVCVCIYFSWQITVNVFYSVAIYP